jgi:hypothetical protein
MTQTNYWLLPRTHPSYETETQRIGDTHTELGFTSGTWRPFLLSEGFLIFLNAKKKKNSMVWVREQTIPTKRPPLIGEVSANFLRIEGATWSAWRIPTAVFSVSRQEPLLFYQVAPQLYSRGWVYPVPDPLLFFLVVPGIEPWPADL